MPSKQGDETDRGRTCDRCGRSIHDLEPATGIQFGGSVQSEELLVCNDCVDGIVGWWDEGEAVDAE